jgi:hypothetical protein
LDEIRDFPTLPEERYHVQPFWTNDTVTDEPTDMHEIAGPQNKYDIDDVAAISRERINIRKRAEHKKTITETGKSKIWTSFEYHPEKAG